MKTFVSRHRKQLASTLLPTLTICTILSLSAVGYLVLISQQGKLGSRSQAWNLSLSLAEAGIEEGLEQLNVNHDHLSTDGWTFDGSAYSIKRTFANGNSYTVFITNSSTPSIFARADVVSAVFAQNMIQPVFAAGGLGGGNSLFSRAVVVTCKRGSLFTKSMVARHRIDLNGNNISTDSYDSSDPTYSTGGHWDPAKAKSNGDVASNDTIINSVNVGNANIHGHVSTGPGGTVSIGPKGAIGSYAWQAINSGKGIEPGWISDDSNFEFPETSLPYTSGLPPASGWYVTTTNYGGTTYYMTNYYDNVLVAGDYYATSLSGKTLILGEARLVLPNGLNMSGGDSITIGSAGKLQLYVGGTSCAISGNAVINEAGVGYPANLIVYCAPTVTSLALNGNGEFSGVLVAPSVDVQMNGGGSSDRDFSGCLIANTITMNGHFKFHYDEVLGRLAANGRFLITSWHEVAPW